MKTQNDLDKISPIFSDYLSFLRKTPLDKKTEHTDRSGLERLLQTLANFQNSSIQVQHEPKKSEKGAPDYKVQLHASIVGYVENKKIGENLDKVLKSEQIAKYQTLSKNIILTDYLQFVWLKDGKVIAREILCYETDLENKRNTLKPDRIKAVADLIFGFMSIAPEGVGRASELALALAARAHLLRDYLADELIRQEKEHREDRLFGLYQAFKAQVFSDLTLAEFADAFAQTLAYGLFLAALNAEKEFVTLRNAPDHVPGSFRLIRELVEFLPQLDAAHYRDIRWVVEEILAIVNTMDVREIHEDLSFRNRKAISRKVQAQDEEEWRLFSKDPFIYFYEDFLGKYDAKLKKSRGVYYTPPPIVNFIVRAIDDILKDSFGIEEGLADHKRVTVLDFACGTGTFLVEVLEKIFETIGPDSGKRDLIIREHILKNIFGFEYLIAPYTIAHLKLSQYLNERQYRLKEDERIPVFLTNTLEPIESQKNLYLPELTRETEEAQSIKDKPILVITGNPPYAGHSKNNGPYAKSLINGYKYIIETSKNGLEEMRPLGKKNIKWLNDDYVKFIRFAQKKIDAVEEGIVGLITNHSWIENPTFKGMRQSLTRSFDQIYVIDLHGNLKKKEKSPDGSKDENVFDIEQGVAISIFVKAKKIEKRFWRADWFGTRIDKYSRAVEFKHFNDLRNDFSEFLKNDTHPNDSEKIFKLDEIFDFFSLGVLTKRDSLVLDFDENSLRSKIRFFLDRKNSTKIVSEKFSISERDRDGWDIENVRNNVSNFELRDYAFRPFDFRKISYNKYLIARPNKKVFSSVLNNSPALLSCRQSSAIGGNIFDAIFITESISDQNYFRRGGASVFPLFINLNIAKSENFFESGKVVNIRGKFYNFLFDTYKHRPSPEEIFGYIYAILHAPAYRIAFAEFLRLDFPRIPFVETRDQFQTLSELGWELAQKHLLKDIPKTGLGKFFGQGDHVIDKPVYSEELQTIAINKTQSFKPVSKAVWEFHIGGYQVIDKYLKSRKGRTLTLDEIETVEKICNVLQFTIDQMNKIDLLYQAAFPDHRKS